MTIISKARLRRVEIPKDVLNHIHYIIPFSAVTILYAILYTFTSVLRSRLALYRRTFFSIHEQRDFFPSLGFEFMYLTYSTAHIH